MTLKIVKALEPMPVEQLVICIYGAPGVGKSTLGYTAEDALLLDFDKGAYRAANRKDTVPVDTWEDVLSITGADLAPYRTIVIDTAGRALDALTTSIIKRDPKKGRGGALTLQGYGSLRAEFTAWMKSIRQFGKDVVLLAHMDEQRSGDETVERIDVQGGSKGEIYKVSDAMGRVLLRDGKRVLLFSPSDTAFGKNPGQLDALEVPDVTANPQFLADVVRAIKDRLNTLTEEQREAQKAVEFAADLFETFKTAEQFNTQMTTMADATKAEKAILVEIAKRKGIFFDKAHKAFMPPVEAEVTA
jgi:hypothetical protein